MIITLGETAIIYVNIITKLCDQLLFQQIQKDYNAYNSYKFTSIIRMANKNVSTLNNLRTKMNYLRH